MKKLLLALVLGLVLVLCSCIGNSSTPNGSSTTPYTPAGDEPPIDRTWISPGKVQVGNFYPGAKAEWPITVHNGNEHTAAFSVTYRIPDNVGEGYAKSTTEVEDWVIITDPTPVLAPYETREILVVLIMPAAATAPGGKWEFWISVKDTTQTGMVQTELCSRWLVVMR